MLLNVVTTAIFDENENVGAHFCFLRMRREEGPSRFRSVKYLSQGRIPCVESFESAVGKKRF